MSETTPALRYATLGDMLRATAAAYPDKVAVICDDRRRTYRDLDQMSDRTANALVAAGYGGQEPIGVIGKNSDAYLEILFGIVKAGAAAAVLNWRLALPELRAIAEDAGIAILLYDLEFASVVEQLQAVLPARLTLIAFDGGGKTRTAYDRLRDDASGDLPPVTVLPTDNAILMYTSGATGTPKGVPASHFAMLYGIEGVLSYGPDCGSTERDVNLLTTPLFHLAAFGWSFSTIYTGATLVILPQIDMASIVAAIAAHRVTRAVVLPALMPALLESADGGTDLSSLRLLCYGASPIPEPLLARMVDRFRCGFLQNYGMTEISGAATCLVPGDHFPGSKYLLSCGRTYPGVEIRIEAADGRPCSAGEIGEIMLRTPSLFRGYWRRPNATDEVIRAGWYATGDMGYLDPDGYLFLRDRKKDMIVSGGENVFPAEVESALTGHPDVVRAAVIGVPSERWGEEVKAVVIRRAGSSLTAEALIAFLRPLIAGYKLPKSVDFVTELPLTPIGKVAKPALREKYWAGRDRRIN
jgi:acyl-CoA synthetase (AMP-forming)/AMP-acid ligase II